jgi:MFS family permease
MLPTAATRPGTHALKGWAVRTVEIVHEAGPEQEADLARPRDDPLLLEAPDGPGRFRCAEGPFQSYERTVERDGDRLVERIEYEIAIPGWGGVFQWAVRRRLTDPSPHPSWWMPPDRLDAPTAVALSCLAAFTLVAGYTGTLIAQTITFAADEFGESDRAQGTVLAAVRVGVLLALVLVARADRLGRRTMIRVSAYGACAVAATGALAPNLVWLGISQTIARGLSTALALLLGILAAELVPRNSRAWTVSILALTAALGSGMAVWCLPLADLGEPAWRLLYLVPLAGIPFTTWVIGGLPESARFEAAAERPPARAHAGRFWLLAASAFLGSIFLAPASQFMNDFLRDDLDFSAARITVFTLLTNTPGIIGVVIGGRLADVRGRRIVAAVALAGGVGLTVAMYLSQGWSLWVLSIAATIIGAGAIPALGVYGPELFATTARGRANGLISVLGVTGSALGLLVVGSLSDRSGGIGAAMPVVAIGPALLAVLILVAYPETAHQELEDINPEDR